MGAAPGNPQASAGAAREQSGWDLLQGGALGRPDDFALLVQQYDRFLRYLIARRGRSLLGYADLQEIVDETWYQVLRRADRAACLPSGSFSAWLGGLCLNVLKDRRLRPIGRHLACLDRDGGRFAGDPPGNAAPPDQAVERAEILAALRDCLDQRTEGERHAYELIYVQGLSKSDAARRLHCSEAYVRQKLLPRLHEAVARCLGGKGFGDRPMA